MSWLALRAEVLAEFFAKRGAKVEAGYREYIWYLRAGVRRPEGISNAQWRRRQYGAKYRSEQPDYYRLKWREANQRRRAKDPDGVREYGAAWERANNRKIRRALAEAGHWVMQCAECGVPWMPMRRGARHCSERCHEEAVRRRNREAKRASYAKDPGYYNRKERERRKRNGDAVRAADMARYHKKMRELRAQRPAVHCSACGVEFCALRKDYKYCSQDCAEQTQPRAEVRRRTRIKSGRAPIKCAVCGVEFWPLRTIYLCCSKACSALQPHLNRGKRRIGAAKLAAVQAEAEQRRARPGYLGPRI